MTLANAIRGLTITVSAVGLLVFSYAVIREYCHFNSPHRPARLAAVPLGCFAPNSAAWRALLKVDPHTAHIHGCGYFKPVKAHTKTHRAKCGRKVQ
jgi:hypothetical protein